LSTAAYANLSFPPRRSAFSFDLPGASTSSFNTTMYDPGTASGPPRSSGASVGSCESGADGVVVVSAQAASRSVDRSTANRPFMERFST
jgi:hypothetical protein